MKKIIYFITAIIVSCVSFSCSVIDNYDEPNETLKGQVIDSGTQETLQTEANSLGIRIKLMEYSWNDDPTPYYFYAMQDGTFNNTKIFKGNYNIVVEGAFVPLVQTANGNILSDKSINTDVDGVCELTFEVEPFLRVEWVGEPVYNSSNGTATVKVKITRGTQNSSYQQNITDVFLFVNQNPYACSLSNNYDSRYSTQITYGGDAANALLGETISITTTGVLPEDRTLYLRVGARIDCSIAGVRRYNYNEVKPITIP